MATLKETAKAFQPKKTKNIADLEQIDVDLNLELGVGVDNEGKEFEYNFVTINAEEYRVPDSVIAQLKETVEARPDIKKFKVKKTGAGMQTRYTVVGL